MAGNIFFIIFYISFAAFLWPLLQEYEELSLLDVTYATSIFIVVIIIEFILVYLLIKLLSLLSVTRIRRIVLDYSEKIKCLFSSIIISLNIHYFCITLIPLQFKVKLIILLSFMLAIYFLITNLDRLKFTLRFCSIFLALSFLQFGYSYVRDDENSDSQNWKLEKYQPLFELKSRPDRRNIYMLSFDSAVSPYSLKTLYDDREAIHIDYLKEEGFRILDNAYSAGDATRVNFFNMMNLGEKEARNTRGFFSVKYLNPSYSLFENAGYKIQFLFRGHYFGYNTNTLDYFYPEESFITFCDFIKETYGLFACNTSLLNKINYLIRGITINKEQYFRKLLERIKFINNHRGDKWITISHIYSPGHTSDEFVYTDIQGKKEYIKRAFEKYISVKDMIEQIITLIKTVDQNPIVFIYADHGAWLTRGLEYGEENPYYTTDEIYLDKHGILFAVYPYDFCQSKFTEGYNTVNLIPDMLECELNRK